MKLPDSMMEMLRGRRGLDNDNTSQDAEIEAMDPVEIVRECAAWRLGDRHWPTLFAEWMAATGTKSENFSQASHPNGAKDDQVALQPDKVSHWAWAPIEKIFAPEDCANFMFMSCHDQNKNKIYLYKHRDTRRYINLDANGCAYRFAPDLKDPTVSYHQIPLTLAIAHALS